MKKVLGTALAVGAAMLGSTVLASNANAAVTFNVGVATDYVFRGISQFGPSGNDQPEVFGGADWASKSGAFYAGTWISNTSTDFTENNVEYDLYGGWKPAFGGVNWDFGAIWYGYTDGNTGQQHKASYGELKAGGSVPVGDMTLGAKVYWSNDFVGDFDGLTNQSWYEEVNASYTFKSKAVLSGAIGHQSVDKYAIGDYTTGNIGVTYPITDHLSIDGRFIANNDDAVNGFGAKDKNTVVGTLTATF